MNGEEARISNYMIMAYFKVISRNLSRETKITQNLGKVCR